MKPSSSISLFAAVFIAVLMQPVLHAREYVLVSSDLLSPVLEGNLVDTADKLGIELQASYPGSFAAVEALRKNEADAAIIALPDGRAKPLDDELYIYMPVAFEAAYVAINARNPLTQITTQQLAGIYGEGAELNLTRWDDIGSGGLLGSRQIQTLAISADEDMALDLFKFTAMAGQSLRASVQVHEEEETLYTMLEEESGTIAILPQIPESESVKVVPVAEGGGAGSEELAFDPTPQNIYYGDYIFRLPLYLVFERSRQEELLPIVRLMMSDEVAEMVDSKGFVPVPANLRKSATLNFGD